MEPVIPGNSIWIDTHAALQDMTNRLEKASYLAVDTESNSLYVYREQVCLIQFSIPEADYLVDPIIIKNLSALAPIFSNPAIEKIFHAAEYDILCLKRDFGFKFENIFDTMHASRVLGRTSVGLGPILEAEFGITVDKRYQRADWGRRPLPKEYQAYARLDTHYLIQLRNQLNKELETANRMDLAIEDFKRLCKVQPAETDHNGKSWWHVSGNQALTPIQSTVLAELCSYRESIARTINKPVFKVLSNQQLVNIAIEIPGTRDDLSQKCGLNQALVRRHGEALLQTIQRGIQQKTVQRPPANYPDRLLKHRIDSLKQWRKMTAETMGVESDIILPRDLMDRIANSNPRQLENLSILMESTPWRFVRFGNQILDILAS